MSLLNSSIPLHSGRLPIDEVLPELIQQLHASQSVLLSAAPGAGKTTRVPLALLNETWLEGQRIILLEPRRLAARHAAQFMAQQLDEKVGEQVGYRIRLETCISPQTRIEVVTEGILTRMLQQDPELSGVGLVIFDEFHERNLHADLAFALAHQCQQLLRPDLRLLIMSATLDEKALTEALKVPLVVSQGRSFPVDVYYQPLTNTNQSLTDHCARVVKHSLTHEGDVLVFLPGVREIHQVQNVLADLPCSIQVFPLHGQLSDTDQKAALTPATEGLRKIILTTNIAESSLTVEGVRIVVDSGLERRNLFHLASGLHKLTTRQISRASATQRSGRAGRQAPGVCYRLWPEQQHDRLDAHIRAEILESDLAPLLMTLMQWGADANELFWLTPPPSPALHQARDLLAQLGMLTPDQTALNQHGNACASLGIEPRWAHALLTAHALGYGQTACEWVALIQEWPSTRRQTDDLMRLYSQSQQQRGIWKQRIHPLTNALWRSLKTLSPDLIDILIQPDDLATLLVALAYPDRIAKRRDQGNSFQLSHGRGAECSSVSDHTQSIWLACADLSTHNQRTVIRLAARLSPSAFETLEKIAPQLFSHHTEIGWQTSGQFSAQRHHQLGQIRLSSKKLPNLTTDEWQTAWLQYIQQHGLHCLPWPADALNLRARMKIMHQHLNEDWPDVSDKALLSGNLDWLMPYLLTARHQRDLEKTDTNHALNGQLNWRQKQQLDLLLPTHFQVPSGSFIAIDYTQNPPVLAVKLQEMFGYQAQPTLLNGKVSLQIHLLSPARRPIQVTSDLAHFWRHTYAEVRKEMRGKYPKHPWPLDPFSTEATKLTKAALERSGTNNGYSKN